MNLSPAIEKKIWLTPFGHFLDSPLMKVDSALLDDTCGRWESGCRFRFEGEHG